MSYRKFQARYNKQASKELQLTDEQLAIQDSQNINFVRDPEDENDTNEWNRNDSKGIRPMISFT